MLKNIISNQLMFFRKAYKHNTKTFTRPKRRNLDFVSIQHSIL